MEDLKSSEQRATVEDLMYASVLEKFMDLKVEMMPRYPLRCALPPSLHPPPPPCPVSSDQAVGIGHNDLQSQSQFPDTCH